MATGTVARPHARRRFRDTYTRPAIDELRADVALSTGGSGRDAHPETGSMTDGSQALFDPLKQLLLEIDAKVSRQALVDDLDPRSACRDRAERGFDRGLYEYDNQAADAFATVY
jgi:hypothetical protein